MVCLAFHGGISSLLGVSAEIQDMISYFLHCFYVCIHIHSVY